jgi:hypothetical protein
MANMTTLRDRVAETARRQQQDYAGGEDRPLRGYVATMSVYGTLVAGTALLARVTRRQIPDRIGPWDAALIAAATFKLSRLIAKDSVTSPLRAPFTAYEGPAGPAELAEQVRGQGARKAAGELISCPFCIGTWAATAFTAGHVFAPRLTRLVTASLAAQAAADFLQFAHARAEQAAEGGSQQEPGDGSTTAPAR